MTARYAVYFAPERGSPWWKFGAHWLGRDEREDTALLQEPPAPLGAAELRDITAQPRHYGFHATLKAPFRLRDGHRVDHLVARLQALAGALKPVALGPLQAVTLGDFVALVPTLPPDELAVLAAACVTVLDDLRAPVTPADLARRRAEQLDTRELALLQQYGYPYVLERFRLHFTLSGPVARPTAQRVLQAVAVTVAGLNQTAPLVLDRLCLFVQAAPGRPFQRIADAGLRP